MLKISDIFVEYVRELGDDFEIDVVNSVGVSFYHKDCKDGMKFTIVRSPMFGVESGHVGLAVVKLGYFQIDSQYKYEDPNLLEKISDRLKTWL